LARAEGPTPAHALDLVPTEGRMLQCFLASILQAPMAEGVVLALEKLYASIDPATCIASADRAARLTLLTKKVRALEIEEENIVEALEAEGIVVDRRADAEPAVVLGLVGD